MEDLKPLGSVLERLSWALILLSMLTQMSASVAFPAYGVVLGFWGVYSSFTLHARALFGFISFTVVSLVLDIVFCAMRSKTGAADAQFALIVFIFCMFAKLPALWYSSRIFSLLGGASALDDAGYAGASPTKARGRNYAFE
mgnify:CR=1 FL=1